MCILELHNVKVTFGAATHMAGHHTWSQGCVAETPGSQSLPGTNLDAYRLFTYIAATVSVAPTLGAAW